MTAKLVVLSGMLIVALLIAFSIFIRPSELLSLASPNNRYNVQITERREFPYVDSESAYLNAASDGKYFLDEKLLYSGDFLDDDFIERYPGHRWLSESVLKIGQLESEQNDRLRVSNRAALPLKYLLIETYRDKFIVFDLKPGETIDFGFRYDGRLSVEGEFADSGRRFGEAIKLIEEDANGKQFFLDVKDERVNIESPQRSAESVGCCAVDRARFSYK